MKMVKIGQKDNSEKLTESVSREAQGRFLAQLALVIIFVYVSILRDPFDHF